MAGSLPGAELVDELELAKVCIGEGDFAPVLGAALEGPEPDGVVREIDVLDACGEGLGDPAPGVGEGGGEGGNAGVGRGPGCFEETPAFVAVR